MADEALLRLPSLGRVLMRHPPTNSTDERTWRTAIDTAVALQTLLANPPANGEPSEESLQDIQAQSGSLQAALRSITARFVDSAAQLRKDAERGADAALVERIEETLELPWLPAD